MSELAGKFIQACLRDDVMTIHHLLDRGADVDQRTAPPYDHNNSTVLHLAATNGFTNTCSILLASGAHFESHDDNDWTPLQCACAAGKYGVARLLIEYGASINAEASLNSEYTPMNLACTSGAGDLIQLLINSGAAVNVEYDPDELVDDDDDLEPEVAKPPLYTAYVHNNAAAVRVLLDNNAKCDLMQRIHVACLLGSMQALKGFLRDGDKINVRDSDGKTPLHVAVRAGHDDLVRQCLQYKAKVYKTDSEGRTPLHYAVKRGNVDIIAMILKHRPLIVHSSDKYGATPLRIACQQNNLEVVDMILRLQDGRVSYDEPTSFFVDDPASLFATNDVEIISRLLKYGYKVNTKDSDNSTLLHKACQNGDKDLVNLLLEFKPKLNARETPHGHGFTPLHIACREGHTDIALTLIQHGAQVAVFDLEESLTPLHMACEIGDFEIVQELLKRKCDNAYECPNQEVPETPLDIATRKGHYKIVELLLKTSPDMDNDLFRTRIKHPLLVACENIEPKLVRLFLKYGSNVEGLDHSRTPLVAVIHAYKLRLRKGTKHDCVNDVISILIMLISHGCQLGYLYTDMEYLAELHKCECVFGKRNDVTRFLLLTGIDIVDNISDSFLAAILRHRDFEILRMLAASGFVFNETQLEEVCFDLDSGDMLLSAARDAIFQVPSLQNLCRAKIRRVLRTTLHEEDELRRKRHLSSRIGDYFRKVTGKKPKRLPVYGIDRQIDALPLPARIKDFLCFRLYDVT